MRRIILLICMIIAFVSSNAQWGSWTKLTNFHYVPDKITNFNGKMVVAARYNEVSLMRYSYDILLSEDQGTSWDIACSFHSTLNSTVVVTNLAVRDSLLHILVQYTTDYSREYKMFTLDHSGTLNNLGICDGIDEEFTSTSFIVHRNIFFLGGQNSYGYSKIYKSIDYGKNWILAGNGMPDNYSYITDLYSSGDRLFMSLELFYGTGLLYSEDDGESWIPCMESDNMSVFNIEGNDDRLFIATSEYIYYSTDLGNTWISTGISGIEQHFAVEGNEIFAGRPGQILRSHDNGETWGSIQLENFNGGTDLQSAFYDESDSENFYFIHKIEDHLVLSKLPISKDSVSFQMNGISQNNTISILMKNSIIIEATAEYGVYYSSDHGITWSTRVNELTGTNVKKLIEHNSLIYAATDKGLYYTSNLGDNWSVESGLALSEIKTLALYEESLYAGIGSTIYYQKGISDPWTELNVGLPGTSVNYLYSSDDTLYACTETGVFLLYDNNQYWQEMEGPTGNISSIVKSGELLFLSSDYYIFQSENYGHTWKLNTLNEKVNYLTNLDRSIFVSTDSGLFRFEESTDEWISYFYDEMQIYDIKFTDLFIYVTAHGGIYIKPLADVLSFEEYNLDKGVNIYPVPFTSFINICIPESRNNVQVTIMNSESKLVYERTFSNSQKEIRIESLDELVPGFYFVRVVSNNKAYIKKVAKL